MIPDKELTLAYAWNPDLFSSAQGPNILYSYVRDPTSNQFPAWVYIKFKIHVFAPPPLLDLYFLPK